MTDLRDLSAFRLMEFVKAEWKRSKKVEIPAAVLKGLVERDPQPIKDYENILTSFFTFHDWLQTQMKAQTNLLASIQAFDIEKGKYRSAVAYVLDDFISKRKTGQAVLSQVTSADTQVEIVPGSEEESRARAGLRAIRLGIPMRDSFGAIDTGGRDEWRTVTGERVRVKLGKGGGDDSTVSFSPQVWGPKGTGKKRGPGTLPDEVLHHELVHAGREMHGLIQQFRVEAVDPRKTEYGNVEEFYAVVITNIYISEKAHGRKVGLRNDHTGFEELKNPEKFLENRQGLLLPPGALLEGLRKAQPHLWDDLSTIGRSEASFNPVRDWEVERRKVLVDV